MIPLLKPSCTEIELTAVNDVLRSGWWGHGPKCEQFEREIALYHGYKYAVTVNSATAALHLSLIAAGVGSGDEVIVPALTFVSTALAVLYVGATPVFADIDPYSLCMSQWSVNSLITERTKAIIPVDFAGYPAHIASDLPIIQDAAHATGGLMYGDFVCLSFHPVKNLATGDGGAILTNSKEAYERMKALRWCGIDKSTHDRTGKRYSWDYNINELGYKCHWNDIQAAIGVAQLRRISELLHHRREIATIYYSILHGHCELPCTHTFHTWHLYTIRVNAAHRNDIIDALAAQGISAGVHYKPITMYPMFEADTPPITAREWQRLVSLPMYYDLSIKDAKKVAYAVRDLV